MMADEKMNPEMMEAEPTAPLEDAISKVESYIANPKLVTPETLGELLALLQQIQADENPEEVEEKPSLESQIKGGGSY